jgi:glucokinase
MNTTLIADIGGTNARFALADQAGYRDAAILRVADYAGPAAAVRAYLAGKKDKPDSAVFAMAGPVNGDRFELTNFPWSFSVEAVRGELGLDTLALINDFHALALGVLDADPKTILQIGGGTAQPRANIGIIGPGTGLGVASLIWDDAARAYTPVPCEGGHVTIPVTTQREFDITQWLLQNKYHHVSAERVCSGKGLLNLYDAIRALDNAPLPDLNPEDITARAVSDACVICKECLTLMLGFLGRVAGNLALTNATFGGVYFAGGILPRLGVAYLQASRLRGDFIAKGRQTAYVDRVPTFVIDDPYLALRGLRRQALSG